MVHMAVNCTYSAFPYQSSIPKETFWLIIVEKAPSQLYFFVPQSLKDTIRGFAIRIFPTTDVFCSDSILTSLKEVKKLSPMISNILQPFLWYSLWDSTRLTVQLEIYSRMTDPEHQGKRWCSRHAWHRLQPRPRILSRMYRKCSVIGMKLKLHWVFACKQLFVSSQRKITCTCLILHLTTNKSSISCLKINVWLLYWHKE